MNLFPTPNSRRNYISVQSDGSSEADKTGAQVWTAIRNEFSSVLWDWERPWKGRRGRGKMGGRKEDGVHL